MDLKALTVTIKADVAEAEAAMSRLEAGLDRILKKQELVVGRTMTMLYALDDAERLIDAADRVMADDSDEVVPFERTEACACGECEEKRRRYGPGGVIEGNPVRVKDGAFILDPPMHRFVRFAKPGYGESG